MIAFDENALICDLAETYQIYDYRSLPVFTVAALSAGLRENSRIQTKMRGGESLSQEYLLALLYDLLVVAFGGKDAGSLLDLLDGTAKKKKPKEKASVFNSAEEYERARRKAIGKE